MFFFCTQYSVLHNYISHSMLCIDYGGVYMFVVICALFMVLEFVLMSVEARCDGV